MDPRAGLDGCGKSRPLTGIRPPDRPARSESLYRQSYPGRPKCLGLSKIFVMLSETLIASPPFRITSCHAKRGGFQQTDACRLWIICDVCKTAWHRFMSFCFTNLSATKLQIDTRYSHLSLENKAAHFHKNGSVPRLCEDKQLTKLSKQFLSKPLTC